MTRPAICARLAILAGLCATALAGPRLLLQADADIIADDQFEPVFQLVSNNSDTDGGPSVPYVACSLEMDTDASYSSVWRNGREDDDWRDGNTRWNVTVQFEDSTASGTYSAALHSVVCSEVGLDTLYVPPGNNSLGLGNLTAANGMANFSTVLPFLIDYDAVQSMAIYNGFASAGPSFVGCVNLIPPPPDFPSDWSSMIESNLGSLGLTFTVRQLYSHALNKARMDLSSFQNERIILIDYNSTNITFISPQNATYPHGVCSFSQNPDVINWMTDDSNTTLLDTSTLLRFDYTKVQYVPGHEIIRGIVCEKWTYDSRSEYSRWAGNYTATYYFPVNQWRVGRQDYHRLLKEIHVTGTLDDGREIDNRFEYVNFKPQNYTQNSAAFDVCALAPQGANCGCTRERIAALNGLQLDSDPDGVVIDSSTAAGQNGNCQLQSSTPHGFVSQQAGPYVGLVIIGMVAGALFTLLGTWAYYRRFVGVGVRDRVGHVKFGEGGM